MIRDHHGPEGVPGFQVLTNKKKTASLSELHSHTLKHLCVLWAALFALIFSAFSGRLPRPCQDTGTVLEWEQSFQLQEFASVAYWNVPLPFKAGSPHLQMP